jgi:hydrogenase maturation protease
MDAMRLRGDLPEKRALIGIEPQDMDWGTRPTEAVAAALPEAAAHAHQLVRNWRSAATTEACE